MYKKYSDMQWHLRYYRVGGGTINLYYIINYVYLPVTLFINIKSFQCAKKVCAYLICFTQPMSHTSHFKQKRFFVNILIIFLKKDPPPNK